jgi:transcriptional regulator with XRE-family HTH domain
MATDYGRSIQYVRDVTSRIDKDLKVELRETAFNMWLACYGQQEIADQIGYGQPAVNEFVKNLQVIRNGTGAENDNLSKKPPLAKTAGAREFDLWLACHTQEEIAEREGMSQPQIKEILSEMAELPKPIKASANHLTDFEVPLYNIWKFKEKSRGSNHFGNSEPTILDNLLYRYPGRIFAYKIFRESRCRRGIFYRDLPGMQKRYEKYFGVGVRGKHNT